MNLPKKIKNFYIVNYQQRFKINVLNKIRFGKSAPVFKERIWVKPSKDIRFKRIMPENDHSGIILRGDWDLETVDIFDKPKIRSCYEHWVNGVPWNETEAYLDIKDGFENRDIYIDGIKCMEELEKRYERLDQIFEEIKKEKRIKTSTELGKTTHPNREIGGVKFHIGRDGQPIFSGSGRHRYAISLILELPIIPATIGVVHPDGVKYLAKLRNPPK